MSCDAGAWLVTISMPDASCEKVSRLGKACEVREVLLLVPTELDNVRAVIMALY